MSAHLYTALLFQGPLFQRILSVDDLDLTDPVHRRATFTVRRETADDPSLPDPYFLDALLQSLQVLVPQDLCLPVGIDEVLLFAPAFEGGSTTVSARIGKRTKNGYVSRILAVDAKTGRTAVVLDGYKTTIAERFVQRQNAQAFFDPVTCDRASIAPFAKVCKGIGIRDFTLEAIDDDDGETQPIAIAHESGINPSAVGWDGAGKPILQSDNAPQVAVSHGRGRLLTVTGPETVACHLQPIPRRPGARHETLPEFQHGLWRALTERFGNPDRAGTAVLALHQCLLTVGVEKADITPDEAIDREDMVALAVTDRHIRGRTLICLREFVLAGPMAVAVFSGRVIDAGADSEQRSRKDRDRNRILRPIHYERDETLTFKDVLPPLRVATAPVFFRWMGDVREHAMWEIREPLAEAFGAGGKGMVTNLSEIEILGPPVFSDRIRTWVWLERILATSPSTFELGFQWAGIGPDGTPVHSAGRGRQRLTWVDMGPGGELTAEPFPAFFATFLTARTPAEGGKPFSPPKAPGRIILPATETSLWCRGADTDPGERSASIVTHTDPSFSNFVGNIYFSHYALWLERACQSILQEVAIPDTGGYYGVRLRVDHRGEAMPGDRIEARAELTKVRSHGCHFRVEFRNLSADGRLIATGNATYLALAECDVGYVANRIATSLVPGA